MSHVTDPVGKDRNAEKPVDEEYHIEGRRPVKLSADAALEYAHSHPASSTPIHICFGNNDLRNPRSWSWGKKTYITVLITWINFLYSIGVSSLSLGFADIAEEYNVSVEVATIALTMYALGGIGTTVLAPLSEYYGRRPVYIVSWFCVFIFTLATPLAPNFATILVCRFIGAALGASPATNTGTIHDLWVRDESGPALALYAISTVTSPPTTLVMMGYLVQNVGWRYTQWLQFALFGATLILLVFTVPETRHNVILQKTAKEVEQELKKEGLHVQIEDENATDRKGLLHLVKSQLLRPYIFLFTEPIVTFLAIYQGFLFGIVYIFQGAFPLVFGDHHGFNVGEQGLSFLGLVVGTLLGAAFNPLQDRYYLKKLQELKRGVPEARMWAARWASFLFPISLFWFAWTSYASIHWIVPIIASTVFGFGFFIILLAILSYVVDAYGSYAASALASCLFIRALVGAFPLFGTQMYNNLGFEWASSLLGFLSLLLVPIPLVLFYKGETLRLRSPWAKEHFWSEQDLG